MIGFYLKYNNELKWAKVCIFLFPFPANVSLYFKISQFPKSVAGKEQKMEFFIEDFSLNVTKSAGNCGFSQIY